MRPYAIAIACLAAAPLAAATVSTGPELVAAIAAASGGETITLADGAFGVIHIDGRDFASTVTIRAINHLGPVIDKLEITDSSRVRIQGIRATAGRESILVEDSHHIELVDCECYGQDQYDRSDPHYSQVSQLYGIQVKNCEDVLIAGCVAHDIVSAGIVCFGVTRLTVRDCEVEWTAADGYKFGGVHDALIEDNTGMREVHSSPDAHKDFMQVQGASSGLVFRGNWALMKSGSFQGIFANVECDDVLLEDNIIYTGHSRGISIGGTNVVARNNTLLAATTPAGDYLVHKQVGIHGATSTSGNLIATYPANAGPHGDDVYLQYGDGGAGYHYDDSFVNAMAGPGLTIEDLRPVTGSPADGSIGAWRRIAELLDGLPSGRRLTIRRIEGWSWGLDPAHAVGEAEDDHVVFEDLSPGRAYRLRPLPSGDG